MLDIKEASASTILGVDKILVRFSIKDTNEKLDNYKFSLLKSNFSDDDFFVVKDSIEDFECFDYDINIYNSEIRYFYKIRTTNLVTGEERDSFVFNVNEVLSDEYGFYFSELYSIYLDTTINNTSMLLLKRKRTGEICDCFDDIRNTSRATKCPKCYGAKYRGGYYNHVDIGICYNNTATDTERFEISGISSDETPIHAWTGNYPIIQQGDVLVDKDTGTRYIIMSCTPSVKSKTLIRQSIQMQRIPQSDVIYKLKIEDVI